MHDWVLSVKQFLCNNYGIYCYLIVLHDSTVILLQSEPKIIFPPQIMTKTSKQIILLHVIEKVICNFKMKWFDKKNCRLKLHWKYIWKCTESDHSKLNVNDGLRNQISYFK